MDANMVVLVYLPSWQMHLINKVGLLARSSGLECYEFTASEDLRNYLEKNKAGRKIIFTDCENLPLAEQLDKIYENIITVAFFSTTKLQTVAKQISGIDSLRCMIATQDLDIDARDVLVMLKKFQEAKILGLQKYLSYGAEIQEKVLTSEVEKEGIVKAINDYVAGLGGDGDTEKFAEYGRRTSELVDELVLNAVFNANPKFKSQPRGEPFKLQGKEVVGVKWGFDGEFFGVSVADPFGSLQRDTILHYLQEGTITEKVSERTSGGLGIKVIFDRLHKFIVNVEPGAITKVICLLRFEPRLRDFEKRKRSFYYFCNTHKDAS